jgi:hypothetical protein
VDLALAGRDARHRSLRDGRYGVANTNQIPDWWDSLIVVVWSLIIYHWAVSFGSSQEYVVAAVRADEDEIASEPELNIA